MKIISSKFLMVFFFMFNVATVLAGSPTPGPPQKGPIKPPVAPIDENLSLLLVGALSFGIYIIYKNKQKTPA
ncbi:hypothetical protein OA93_10270 [Flavobacterium sp. KMS]|uniref:hypothetical protein n=1 Tax=Flavobacterium sp. KMS TaxID=1566023 RepID=UPI00057D6DD0|nr:hypothetical protein [Flavobacterium sp. KMS]KIA98170.1 hypothetical protein OA93_10270 [Flavobacterium sp. KMS]